MNIARHLRGICKGAGIGFLVGLASIATIDRKTLFILRVVLKPVEILTSLAQRILGLSDGTTALMGWVGAATYCMILGGLLGWAASVFCSKAAGD